MRWPCSAPQQIKSCTTQRQERGPAKSAPTLTQAKKRQYNTLSTNLQMPQPREPTTDHSSSPKRWLGVPNRGTVSTNPQPVRTDPGGQGVSRNSASKFTNSVKKIWRTQRNQAAERMDSIRRKPKTQMGSIGRHNTVTTNSKSTREVRPERR